jgi:hypothetical protein
MKRIGVVFGLAVALAGCRDDPVLEAQGVCDVLCDCFFVLPGENERCTSDCVNDIAGGIPTACVDCIYEYECRFETNCSEECFGSKPLGEESE